jgi:phosphatidylserine/phosphatidylglycerophosphate/cardiolipin synthase-like enzyme
MPPSPEDWFLPAGERGNPDTAIDAGRNGRTWTASNALEVLVDGHEYFRCLRATLDTAVAGDTVLLAGLEMDADQRLDPDGTALGPLLVRLLRDGVAVRALLWRSHPSYTAARNRAFARLVNQAGGEVVLDNRIRRLGSLHQKFVVLRRGDTGAPDVAFLGGIDLSHGGHDDRSHRGDPQRADLSSRNYGDHPAWHDVQIRVCGPAVQDVLHTFAERWHDPTPPDRRRTPWHRWIARRALVPTTLTPLMPTEPEPDTPAAGPYAVQVLRTYPALRRAYPFARQGERSIARGYLHAFARARRLVYVEDQYLWSYAATCALADALRRSPELRVVIVIPRFPDPAGSISGPASAIGRRNVMQSLTAAGGDRVAVYDLVNEAGDPIYVHSKVCIIDDEMLTIGSDNLNRRSWSHDSELACAIVDPSPGAAVPSLVTATRLRLTTEHLGLTDADHLTDPAVWFDAFAATAARGHAWAGTDRTGPRPAGRVRVHRPDPVGRMPHPVLHIAHNLVLDPDGRPRALRRRDDY